MINKESIIKEFDLKAFGAKGWMRSKQLFCPNCGQNDEFALKFTDRGGVVHCLHSQTCNNYSSGLYKYLKEIGRSDLLSFEREINIQKFPLFVSEIENEENVNLEEKKLPLLFKRIYDDEYLNNRGFLPTDYDLFEIGESRIDLRLQGYIIFQIFDENKKRVAWLARSRKSKKWHDNNLKKYKAGEAYLKTRYKNSEETEFGEILGGVNEITENTDTLIIVEGITDKVSIDGKLKLHQQEEVKCCFTFGNKISEQQAKKIKNFPNIENIFILFDWGTIKQSKSAGIILLKYTNSNVQICTITKKDNDPADLSANEIVKILERSINCLDFNISKVNSLIV